MSWTNYHGHSTWCDGKAPIEDFIKIALERNFKVLGFSSHAPVNFASNWHLAKNNMQSYLLEIEKMKQKYASEITILSALEVDYIPGVSGVDTSSFRNDGFDYFVGSVHYCGDGNGNMFVIDGSTDEFIEGCQKYYEGNYRLLVSEFFELQRRMMLEERPDILGHMDKVAVHNLVSGLFETDSDWYIKELKETFQCARENNVIVEINTKSLQSKGITFPDRKHFRLLAQMGNKVTINSDAHEINAIDLGFKQVAGWLKEAGLKSLTEWVNGEWKECEFDENGIQF